MIRLYRRKFNFTGTAARMESMQRQVRAIGFCFKQKLRRNSQEFLVVFAVKAVCLCRPMRFSIAGAL
jgi:hypothetical protein